jgi:hypothetical protein
MKAVRAVSYRLGSKDVLKPAWEKKEGGLVFLGNTTKASFTNGAMYY